MRTGPDHESLLHYQLKRVDPGEQLILLSITQRHSYILIRSFQFLFSHDYYCWFQLYLSNLQAFATHSIIES